MPNADYDQDTHTFAFLPGAQPTTHDATCRFLKGAIPLRMKAEHVLNTMCPDAFAPLEGEWYEVAGIKVCALFVGGASFASDTLDISLALPLAPAAGGAKWIDKVAKAIADSGEPLPVLNGTLDKVWPTLVEVVGDLVNKLPEEIKCIKKTDLVYDGNIEDPNTGTWFDYITPRMLMSPAGSARNLAQVFALLDDAFEDGDDGRHGAPFIDKINHILSTAAGSRTAMMGEGYPPAQAAQAVAKFFAATMAPQYLTPFIVNAGSEIERRAALTVAAREQPLIEAFWRNVPKFTDLHKLWPNTVNEPISEIHALAINLGITVTNDGVTHAVVCATMDILAPLIAFASNADDNAERTRAVIKAHKAGTEKKGEELSNEDRALLQHDEPYNNLKGDLEKIGPNDAAKMADVLMRHICPIGLMFINNKFSEKSFKNFNAAKTDTAIHSALEDVLSRDISGAKQNWSPLISTSAAKKISQCKLDGTCWFSVFKLLLRKREGISTVDAIERRIGAKPGDKIFTDPEAMRILEWPLEVVFDSLGITGTDAMSFKGIWRALLLLCRQVIGLPDCNLNKAGFLLRLQEIGPLFFKSIRERVEIMLLSPPATAQKPTRFATADSIAVKAFTALHKVCARVFEDIEEGMAGMAYNPSNNVLHHGGSDPRKKQRTDDWSLGRGGAHGDSHQPGGAATTWGTAARQHGVCATPDGMAATDACGVCGYGLRGFYQLEQLIDAESGIAYCPDCWDDYEAGNDADADSCYDSNDSCDDSIDSCDDSDDGDEAGPQDPQETQAAAAERNMRKIETLREAFPGHCAFHVYWRHVRRIKDCRGGDGCPCGSHTKPSGLDDFAFELDS